jgi:hypothetical protein
MPGIPPANSDAGLFAGRPSRRENRGLCPIKSRPDPPGRLRRLIDLKEPGDARPASDVNKAYECIWHAEVFDADDAFTAAELLRLKCGCAKWMKRG